MDFKERGRYLNPAADNPTEARRDFPHNMAKQLDPEKAASSTTSEIEVDSDPASLYRQLATFMSSDSEAKFIALVKKTSADRARRQQEPR